MIALVGHPEGTIVPVHAHPGARKDAVLGERAGALRVAVSAAPERGKANAALQEVLAAALGVKASQVGLLSGETSRAKRFLIVGVTPDEVRARIDALAGRRG